MGPWSHGGWSRGDGQKLGDLNFGSKTGEFFREQIELPFFIANLKKKGDGLKAAPDNAIPKAWLFQTGTNQWRDMNHGRRRTQRAAHCSSTRAANLALRRDREELDEYVSDPEKPVPVLAGIGEGMPGDYMTYDQRFASTRPDVLAYVTDPLDHDVTVAGPITASLNVATSGTDSDFVVKLVDVYPDDYPNPDPNPERSVWADISNWFAANHSAASSAIASRSPSRSSQGRPI